jgi:glycosyltransferase involved in cell wall biosynthesis
MQKINPHKILVVAHSFIEKSGVETYIENLFRELSKYEQFEFILIVNSTSKSYYDINASNVRIIQPSKLLDHQLGKMVWYMFFVFVYAKINNIDLIFNDSGGNTFIFSFGIPTITVIQDLAEFSVKNKYSILRIYYRKYVCLKLNKLLSRSFISPSESTKNDMINYLHIIPEKITVIHDGADHYSDTSNNILRNANNYFLYVGRIDPFGKNLVNLIKAFSVLIKKGYSNELYLVGNKTKESDIIVHEIERLNLNGKIKTFGYIQKDQLSNLYQNAIAFIFPSLYEGFGFPILEAMIHGLPVTCSNTSCLPEIAEDAALYFDPQNIDDISDKMETLVINDHLREQLIIKGYSIAKKYTWQNTARKTKLAIEKELNSNA